MEELKQHRDLPLVGITILRGKLSFPKIKNQLIHNDQKRRKYKLNAKDHRLNPKRQRNHIDLLIVQPQQNQFQNLF